MAYKNYLFALHDDLAKVNEKWGLSRGTAIAETGARHRSTEDYRRWLAEECMTLEDRKANAEKALHDVRVELAIAEKKHKSFTTMIVNLQKESEELEKQLIPLREMQRNSQVISIELAQKIQRLEHQKADVESKLEDKLAKLKETDQLLETLRKDKDEIEQLAKDMLSKANASELSWAHNMSYHLNTAVMDTLASEFMKRFHLLTPELKDYFDGTLLRELAEEGNHVISVALNLVCGFVDEATTIAQTHGGGGGGSTSGWGRDPKDDDRDWALKCLARARKMCTPTIGRKKKM